ncbi:hypothetical protein ILUMI_15760 [Ignelater luminosus]|uniref:Uncharacterized protein n=1 Tax=Ignelater luminosus TaxID=2038154 RepID=A0A8K0G9L2_IGNLU|nr:hypothetical protein ILUMI_15760 [Ignelater luminosus]
MEEAFIGSVQYGPGNKNEGRGNRNERGRRCTELKGSGSRPECRTSLSFFG